MMLCDTTRHLDFNAQQRQNERGKLEPSLTHECKCKT